MRNKIYIIIILLLITATMVTVFLLTNNNRYDVNNDGIVNSLDLLELRKYLIESDEKNDND